MIFSIILFLSNHFTVQAQTTVGKIELTDIYINSTPSTWTQVIHSPNAAYLKIHVQKLQAPGYLSVSEPSGQQRYRYPGAGFTPDEQGGFWALSLLSDTAIVTFHPTQPVDETMEIIIDRYARGYSNGVDHISSVCGQDNRKDVSCYQFSHPIEYQNAQAVARLLIGGTRSCTAWRVGAENHLFTNQHCISTQTEVEHTEVWFNYQTLSCGSDMLATPTIVTGAELLLADSTLDFALFTVNDFEAIASWGYLELDVREPQLGEAIYIPQHEPFSPKAFGIESDHNQWCQINEAITYGYGPQTDTGYYCDTNPGTSGSPVLARSSHKVIALHHFGTGSQGCQIGAALMNRGVRIDRIWPLIKTLLTHKTAVVPAHSPLLPGQQETLAIELNQFIAIPATNGVLLNWQTHTEQQHAGFVVWRGQPFTSTCTTQLDQYFDIQKVTPFIAAQGDQHVGYPYFYRDSTVKAASLYCYLLVEHHINGEQTVHLEQIQEVLIP